MISICLPTRERPDAFKAMCRSALDMASDPNDIEFVSYHDYDDQSAYEYIGNHTRIVSGKLLPTQMYNECYKLAKGPLYLFLPDDIVFETKDWDKQVKGVFDRYPDKIVLVCPDNSDWITWKFGIIYVLHKNWIETVGYPMSPLPEAQSSDRWINEVALTINRRVHLLTMRVNHINVRDRVHRDKNQRGRESQQTKRYYLPEIAEIRKKEAQLLQNFIDNFKQ